MCNTFSSSLSNAVEKQLPKFFEIYFCLQFYYILIAAQTLTHTHTREKDRSREKMRLISGAAKQDATKREIHEKR